MFQQEENFWTTQNLEEWVIILPPPATMPQYM